MLLYDTPGFYITLLYRLVFRIISIRVMELRHML